MIYVHIPFCKSFCVYCGFYSELCSGEQGRRAQKRFTAGLLSEIAARRSEITGAHETGAPDTLYLGGGTPSVLDISCLRRIVAALGDGPAATEPLPGGTASLGALAVPALPRHLGLMSAASAAARANVQPPAGHRWEEFTMEVNPDDIVRGGDAYVRELLFLGVNRVSMGVQSFDDGMLRWMRRRHDSRAAYEAFRLLRTAGVENIGIDLIFGVEGMSAEMLRESVVKALELRPEHISAYQLSIDEDSDLAAMVSEGDYVPLSDEECREQYGLLCRTLGEAGYRHYEVSNWALPGREAVHNSAYWRRVPYVGLGPGAHSFDGRSRSWNSQMRGYYGSSASGDTTEDGTIPWTREQEILTPQQAAMETLMLSLRTARGIDDGYLRREAAPGAVAELLAEGSLAVTEDGRCRIPEERWFVSDDIISRLV